MNRPLALGTGVLLALCIAASSFSAQIAPPGVASTAVDFAGPGTQPGALNIEILPADNCKFCHGTYDAEVEPYSLWHTSMMAQAARDPMFYACLTVAEQEAPGVGSSCLRCHTPGGWLRGNATPTDGSALTGEDFDGVTCNVCHRMVDPIADPANPPADTGILAALAGIPTEPHNGYYVVDPDDVRRGPYDLGQFFNWHPFAESPFHRESLLCGTCHDNSNTLYTRVGGLVPAPTDTYALNPLGQPSYASKYDQFPQQRTYSEWSQSAFASGPIDLGGKFSGAAGDVSSCQDCHMPHVDDIACHPNFQPVQRPDMPRHVLTGANTWVLRSILELDQSHALYGPGEESGLTLEEVELAEVRTHRMLRDAAELSARLHPSGDLGVRVTNDSGHKLPTGFAEGRRMWLNVQFLDADCKIVAEHGGYRQRAATLDADTTKVWEIRLGVDAAASAATGAPTGPGFHYVLSNKIEKDNRIPPRGFTNAGFESVQAHPVGATYADGQYWDDTFFTVPSNAATARVRLYYQTTSRELVEFLRDANTTDDRGDIAYDLWKKLGKSEPFLMEERLVSLRPGSIEADVAEISVSAGGTQTISVDAGPAHAGKAYMLLGSMSGTSPATSFYGLDVPLVADSYFAFTAFPPAWLPIVGGTGYLDGSGRTTASIQLPPGLATRFVERTMHHACLVESGVTHIADWVSCAVRLELRP